MIRGAGAVLATVATTTYAMVSPCAFGTGLCRNRGPLSLWRTGTRTGRTWTRLPLAHGTTAYAVDAQRDVNGRRDRLYASTDSGRHFSARPDINDSHGRAWSTAVSLGDGGRGWGDITYVTNRKGWAIYSPAGFFHGLGKICLTLDRGRLWHFITP